MADPSTHTYPSNRGRKEFRDAVAAFYARRFGVRLDPDTEVMSAIGAKECIFNLNLAFLDPGDVALASDPGYPVYTGGPLLVGGEPVLMPLVPDRGFAPDLDAIPHDALSRARLMFLNYPNNPTGAIVPDGLFEEVVEFARAHGILVVHDNAYSETTYDGYVAPSFLQTPGAKEVGVEVFSLSKGYNMTGWRCAAIVGNADAIELYWRLKSNIDSGNFDAVQLAGAAALAPEVDADVRAMNEVYRRRRDLVCDALAQAGVDVDASEGHDLHLGADPAGVRFGGRVLRARARARRRRDLARRRLRHQRRGLLPDLADDARRPPAGGRRAHPPAVECAYFTTRKLCIALMTSQCGAWHSGAVYWACQKYLPGVSFQHAREVELCLVGEDAGLDLAELDERALGVAALGRGLEQDQTRDGLACRPDRGVQACSLRRYDERSRAARCARRGRSCRCRAT